MSGEHIGRPPGPEHSAGAGELQGAMLAARPDGANAPDRPNDTAGPPGEHRGSSGFVGREDVLAEMDRQLAAVASGWLLVTGGPGTGKSALLAEWRARRPGPSVPHHAIQRNTHGAQPHVIIAALAAQLEQRFPAQRAAAAEPATRLAELLERVSRDVLVPRGERLEVVVDGLDDIDADPRGGSPLARVLPAPLSPGVRFVCATRPEQLSLDWLTRQRGVRWIDLDTEWAQSNHDTVAMYWAAAAAELALTAATVERLVAAADGNILHAVMVRDAIASPPPGWTLAHLPPGIVGLVRELWERCAADPAVAAGLGLLCAAREPLTLELLSELAGWTGTDKLRFLRAARPLLLETGAPRRYRPRHGWIHQQLIAEIEAAQFRGHHRTLADRLATWPAPAQPERRRYALGHALAHRIELEDWPAVWQIAGDVGFLEMACRERGVHEVEDEVMRAVERCHAAGEPAVARRFADLARALAREDHWLRQTPEVAGALVWNRLRSYGWTEAELDAHLHMPAADGCLRVRHRAARGSQALVRDLLGHARAVTACAIMPDGKRGLSASDDRTLKLWDLGDGRVVATLRGHTEEVTACAAMPDGRHAISASRDRTLRLWDLASGRAAAVLEGHTDWVTACAVTPDGRWAISGSDDRTLRVWDLHTGRLIAQLHDRDDAARRSDRAWQADRPMAGVTACTVAPDGRRVVSGSDDRTLRVWDLDTGRVVVRLRGHGHRVTACAVAPDGRRVVSGSDDRTLRVWDLDTGAALAVLRGHHHRVTACAVTPDGSRAVSASDDRTLKLWDLASGRELASFAGHTSWVTACAVTPSGRRMVSASWDWTLKLWDLDAGHALSTRDGHTEAVAACAVAGDGRRAISASDDLTLKSWDLEHGQLVATCSGHAARPTACVVLPDGARAVSAAQDGTLRVWDLDHGLELAVLGGDAAVTACAVTPDGHGVVSASKDRTLQLRRLDGGGPVARLAGHAGPVTACAVTPDGQRVVSASRDHTLRLWQLDGGRLLATLAGHTDWVTACAVTPDGVRAVSASRDRTLKVWDLASGRLLATLEGHVGRVTACAVTPDGRRVVSAAYDQTLRVWDLETYACLLTHRGDAPYTAVAATATSVIAGDFAGTVWFLDVPRAWLRAAAPQIPPASRPELPVVTKVNRMTKTAEPPEPRLIRDPRTAGGAAHHRLRILHISDFHLRGPRETERERRTRVLGASWLANLAELRKDGAFDLVAFTGDVAFAGALDEYLELMRRPLADGSVVTWLDDTLAAVGCTRAQLYVVPGNHDVDRRLHRDAWSAVRDAWSSAGADDDAAFARWIVRDRAPPRGMAPALRGQLLARQAAYQAWVAHGLGRAELVPDPRRSQLGYRVALPPGRLPFAVHVLGLDSAWLAGDDHDARKLRLTDDQILRLCTDDDGEHLTGLRIALVHHPLADLADGERARRLLTEHGVDLLLSGHLHATEAREIGTPDGRLCDLATGCLYQHDRYRNAVTAMTLELEAAGRLHGLELRFRGWSERGHWHDDNSLYRGTRDGRLVWRLRDPAAG